MVKKEMSKIKRGEVRIITVSWNVMSFSLVEMYRLSEDRTAPIIMREE
jgi:hypothetical protein